jgi:hypothetical protein
MMYEFLRRMWTQGTVAESRVSAAIESAVTRGLITQAQADEILSLPRGA